MTPFDAALVACAGYRDRRWLAAAVRHLLGRATADDLAGGAARHPGEPIPDWIARVGPRPRGAEPLAGLARAQLARAGRLGLVPVPIGEPGYPPLLAAIADPPPVLWVRGDPGACARPAVALVGCRAATAAGLEMARRLAAGLAGAGLVVTSGLARGIDSAAHQAALNAGGTSVAVLGSGPDRIYPPEHRGLAAALAGAGAVVSEFPPGVPPLAHHFPLRNRLVSGLVRAVVIVEAPERSGALITAGCALDQGRDVYVVPGAVPGDRNRGGHRLLKDGAKLVESSDDILEELGWSRESPGVCPADPEPDPVLGHLPQVVEFSIDDLSSATGLPAGRVLARLLELELTGRIQRVGSGRFLQTGGRVLT
ncbi:MAG: DNA-processing protein DprA [Vicinamibacterales bacterium]